jgi:hypothetical protein
MMGPRPLLLCLMVFLAALSELRFDWVEQMMGSYLASTNPWRPESGTIWDQGRQSRSARKTLEQIVVDRQDSRREAREAGTFAQIARRLAIGQGAMIGPDRFRTLYLGLPDTVAADLIAPVPLLGLLSRGDWHRTYLERVSDGLAIYFLDTENRVLKHLHITSERMRHAEKSGQPEPGNLDETPQYAGRIFGAAPFFEALAGLDDEARIGVMPRPERLLALPGQILRVAIGDEAVAGHIELAFEIQDGENRQVVRMQGKEWAVWRLHTALASPDGPAISVDHILQGWTSP